VAEGVLFDLDGVLVDSRRAIASCMNAALVTGGYPALPEAELHRFIGPSLSFGFADITGEPLDGPVVAACVGAYRERYADVSLHATEVVGGIGEALTELGPGRRLGVATSKPRAFAEPLLEALGLREHFELIAAPGLAITVESKTVTVAAALQALGGGVAAMVGDRDVDMIAARAHGLRAVGVLWGIGSEVELRGAGADVLLAAPEHLRSAIEGSRPS